MVSHAGVTVFMRSVLSVSAVKMNNKPAPFWGWYLTDGRWVEDDHDAGLDVIESADTRSAEAQGQAVIEGCGGPAAQQMPEHDRAGFFAGQGFKSG